MAFGPENAYRLTVAPFPMHPANRIDGIAPQELPKVGRHQFTQVRSMVHNCPLQYSMSTQVSV
jgi:hypothetical protein